MLLDEMLDRNVRCYPEKEAIVYHDRRYSYCEFGERANRVSHFLMGLGMNKGDRAVLLLKNSPDYFFTWFGTFQVGGALIPLNWRLQPREMQYIVNQSDAKYFLFGADFLNLIQSLKPQLTGVEHFIMIGGSEVPEGVLPYEQLLEQSSSQKPQVEIDEGEVAIQMYTSGTTGYPKGALLTHRNLTTCSYMGIHSNQLDSSGGRGLVAAPLFHIAACIFTFAHILAGGTLVVMDQFDPEGVLKTFEQEKITGSFFAPSMLKMMLDVPDVEKYDYSSLNTLAFGGAPMSYDLLLKCQNVFKCDFLQGFGQTEASPFITTMSQDEYRQITQHPEMEYKLQAVGKDFPGVQVRIVDDQDRDVPVGGVGEIIARGDNIMIGYYHMPEATQETLRGGWLHSGDMGKFDQDRYLYLVDRKKDMIISGGENIYSQEIENVIQELAGVIEVAVVGIPDEKWGEVPKAFVVQAPQAELTPEKVIEFCRNNLARYKCPKKVAFIDALPRNAAGKVLKRNLKESG